jgi:hypothetical protein
MNQEGEGIGKSNLKQKISVTANNLITATKNYAISKGISPVSLLDAAASHLTMAIVELIRLLKICPTPPLELDDDDDDSLIAESPAYYGIPFEIERGNSISSSSGLNQQRFVTRQNVAPGSSFERNLPLRERSGNMVHNSSGLRIGLGVQTQDDEIEDLKVKNSFP